MLSTRDKIIEEAITQMAKKGFSDTSFQAIADKLGVSQSAVLYHFKNKDELIEAVFQTIIANNHGIVAALIQMTDGARERLRKHFIGNLEWAVKHKDQAQLLVLLYYMACFNKSFATFYADIQGKARRRIEEHLHAGVREGVFKFKADAADLSKTLHDTLVGTIVNSMAVPKVDFTELQKRWNVIFDALLL